jgi:hypothetical protein
VTDVLVERHWKAPLTDVDIQRMFERSAGCLDVHRVSWNGSLLSADRRELFCHFSAPDAESVRIAMREAGSARGAVWAGTVHDAPGLTDEELARANVLVGRRFENPVAFEQVQALEDAGAGCLETHRVSFVRTFFSTDRRRMICLYHAPDAESVRIAQRAANMPVERIWTFRQFRP